MALPDDPAERKRIPIYSAAIAFIPSALVAFARVSIAGSRQHGNNGVFDDRSKSNDDLEALSRHFLQLGAHGDGLDTDGLPHLDKLFWRAGRLIQKKAEASGAPIAPAAHNVPPAGVIRHDVAAAYIRDFAGHHAEFAPMPPFSPINQEDDE